MATRTTPPCARGLRGLRKPQATRRDSRERAGTFLLPEQGLCIELHPVTRVRKPLSGYAFGLAAPARHPPALSLGFALAITKVEKRGLEPLTTRLRAGCSARLSYIPRYADATVSRRGATPLTFG